MNITDHACPDHNRPRVTICTRMLVGACWHYIWFTMFHPSDRRCLHCTRKYRRLWRLSCAQYALGMAAPWPRKHKQTHKIIRNHSKSFKIVTYQVLVAFNSFVQDVFGFNRSTAFNWFFSSHEKNLTEYNATRATRRGKGKLVQDRSSSHPRPDSQHQNLRRRLQRRPSQIDAAFGDSGPCCAPGLVVS